jgi:hypothetical protein
VLRRERLTHLANTVITKADVLVKTADCQPMATRIGWRYDAESQIFQGVLLCHVSLV